MDKYVQKLLWPDSKYSPSILFLSSEIVTTMHEFNSVPIDNCMHLFGDSVNILPVTETENNSPSERDITPPSSG
jgi:hypothetical protein